MEHAFMQDQRTTRKMVIAGVDKLTTYKLQRSVARKEARATSSTSKVTDSSSLEINEISQISDIDHSLEQEHPPDIPDNTNASEEDPAFEIKETNETSNGRYNKNLELTAFARTCDRFGISDRSAAAIASSLLMDMKDNRTEAMELVMNDETLVIDKNKVRREKTKVQVGMKRHLSSVEYGLKALYFDGRIDETLYVETTEDGKLHRKKKNEDHLSLIKEPGSGYIGHTSPRSGKATDICQSIHEFTIENNISLDELMCWLRRLSNQHRQAQWCNQTVRA